MTGVSKGKGTAGVMKRHGFSGLAHRMVCTASTARRDPSAAAPLDRVSKVCGWRAGWVSSESPSRTSPCTRSMPTAA